MGEILLHSTTISPYSLGPAHALLALNAERREQAVNLLQVLRMSFGAHEAFNLPTLMRSLPDEKQARMQQTFWDLLTVGALLMAVTPFHSLTSEEERTA